MAAFLFEAWKGSREPARAVVRERPEPICQVHEREESGPPEAFDLDLRGLHCPIPVLRTQSKMAKMRSGDTVTVMASDYSSWTDFPTFAKRKGYELVSAERVGRDFRYVLKK